MDCVLEVRNKLIRFIRMNFQKKTVFAIFILTVFISVDMAFGGYGCYDGYCWKSCTWGEWCYTDDPYIGDGYSRTCSDDSTCGASWSCDKNGCSWANSPSTVYQPYGIK